MQLSKRIPNMNGILVVDKPIGMTSHDVVNYIRRLTGVRRIGHTGTLDPIATGVLPVCIGVATKAARFLQDADKVYRAEIVLGMTTDTYDCEGEVITECEVTNTKGEIIDAILSFQGEMEQIPPMYSAIKKDGKKLYELARQGIEVEREPRKVNISAMSVLKVDMENYTVDIEVECSKGTYIRSLCNDIGKKLKCGAYMNKLRRIKTHSFDISQAYTLKQILDMNADKKLQTAMMNPDKIFINCPKIMLNYRQADSVYHGVQLTWPSGEEGRIYRIYSPKNRFMCISECRKHRLVILQTFWSGDEDDVFSDSTVSEIKEIQ